MPLKHKTLELCLGKPPKVIGMANWAVHGLTPVERYRANFYSLNLYVEGCGELRMDGHVFPVAAGGVSLTPPDIDYEYSFDGRAVLCWFHFVPVAEGMPKSSIPVFQDLGPRFESIRAAVSEVHPDRQPHAAWIRARMWDVLWTLSEGSSSTSREAAQHPAVRSAMDLVGRRLDQPLYLLDMAQEVGVSATHLNRLFKTETGTTYASYVLRTRMTRVHYLLTHTTLAIKAVAAQTGIPNLQVFNKVVKRELGASPRTIRIEQHREPNLWQR